MFGSVLMCKRCWLKQQPKKRVRTRTQGLVGSWPLSSPHGWSSSPRLRDGVSASGPSPPHPFLGAPLPSPSRLGWVSRPGQFQTGSKGCSPLSTHHPLSRGTWIPSAEEEGLGPQPHSQAPGEPRLGVWGRCAWWSVGTGMRPVSASLPRADLDLRTSGRTGCLSAPPLAPPPAWGVASCPWPLFGGGLPAKHLALAPGRSRPRPSAGVEGCADLVNSAAMGSGSSSEIPDADSLRRETGCERGTRGREQGAGRRGGQASPRDPRVVTGWGAQSPGLRRGRVPGLGDPQVQMEEIGFGPPISQRGAGGGESLLSPSSIQLAAPPADAPTLGMTLCLPPVSQACLLRLYRRFQNLDSSQKGYLRWGPPPLSTPPSL